MPPSFEDDVVAHWHKLIGNFQTSSKDFYATVEGALATRQIPGLKTSRVKWSEGGLLSPDREYLRVSGDRHTFDMCAAPFGTGFFFSSWLTKKTPSGVLLVFLLLVAVAAILAKITLGILQAAWRGTGALAVVVNNPFVSYLLVPIVGAMVTLWIVGILARMGQSWVELAVLAIPIIGWFYEKLFARETYYRIDTMLMFQSAVHSAMMEAIDGQTTEKGLRALTEDDRKPVFYKLM